MKAKDLLTKAKAGLILDQPFYASILLKMQTQEDPTAPRIWIDGKTIGYNAPWIESQPLETIKGILAHEISHVVFLHHLRRKGRDFETWNDAADFAINSIIENAGFKLPPRRLREARFDGKPSEEIFNTLMGEKPAAAAPAPAADPPPPEPGPDPEGSPVQEETPGPGPGEGEKEGSPEKETEPEPGEGEEDAQEAQGKDQTPDNDQPQGQEGKDQPQGQGSPQEDKAQGPGGNGQPAPAPAQYSDPGQTGEVRDYPDPAPAAQKQAEEEIKITVIQAATYAKKHGKLSADLERYVEELLNPTLPWKEILSRFIDSASKSDYTWTRPNPRYMAQGFYLPSLNAPEIGRVILAVDTSGSINQEEIKNMVSEIKGILNAYPGTELTVIFCNSKIQGTPETLTQFDDLKEIPRPGGGTDFRPPFTWTEEKQLDPKALIYFTDGECNDFPDPAPDYPILWILTQAPTCYPWNPPTGETVFLNPEDRQPEK